MTSGGCASAGQNRAPKVSRSWTTTSGDADMTEVRIPSGRVPTPPGEMLLEEFIKPLAMTQAELADRIGVSYVRLNEIVNGKRGITPSTALRLAKALGTTAQFWLNGQLALDLYRASHDKEEIRQLELIEPVSS
ncbi:MAG: HigA family addiction module antidote protein [Actinobacteria bacterium]|nr:HigA family addiction module antidote protein [Actinomycetota bacterium]